MAVTKIWAIHDSVSRVVDYCTNPSKTKLSDLEQVLLYAADKEKTLDEGEQQYAVTGIGCRAESAAREMAAVQRRFGKAGGNVAYHAYQSFKTGEVTAEECHRIGVETARRLWGNDRQVLIATHFNTGTYHNHFVVNPVNMWTGKKLEAKYEVYYKLTHLIPDILKLVDEGKIALTPAVELSYLQPSEQEMLFSVMDSDEVTPSLSQARRLRRMSEAQTLTDDAVLQLLSEVKGNQVEYVKVPVDKLRSFFHPDTSVKQMTETLVKAMDFYNKHLARQRKDRDAR